MSDLDKTWGQKRLWLPVLAGVILIVSIVCVINHYVDPFGIYHSGNFLPLEDVNNYQLKLTLFRKFEPPPDAIILGSSQTDQLLSPDDVSDLTGMRCFNYGTAGCTPEIYYAIMKITVDEYDAPLKAVIIGIEMISFLEEGREVPDPALAQYEYARYLKDMPLLPSLWNKYSRLWSIEQLASSVKVVQREQRGETLDDWRAWGEDGAPHYDWDHRPSGKTEPTWIREGVINRVNSLKKNSSAEFSDTRKMYWEMFLDICAENDIKVYAFLTPLHPKINDGIRKAGIEPKFTELIEYLESTLSEMGGTLRDYRRLSSFGGHVRYFRDAIHQTSENGRPLLEDLFREDYPEGKGDVS